MYQPEFSTIGTCGCGPWTGTDFWDYWWSVSHQEEEPRSSSLIFEALNDQQIISTPCPL
jgi:hypothetical protein